MFIPESVVEIGSYAFSGCSGINNLNLPDSLTYIGGGAFSRCTGIKSVQIPNSVTELGSGSFADCLNLTEVIVGESVKSLGSVLITMTFGEVTVECNLIVLEDAGVEGLLTNPDTKISIYSTDGILIKKDCKAEDLKTLNKGIYIIVSGKKHYKISI